MRKYYSKTVQLKYMKVVVYYSCCYHNQWYAVWVEMLMIYMSCIVFEDELTLNCSWTCISTIYREKIWFSTLKLFLQYSETTPNGTSSGQEIWSGLEGIPVLIGLNGCNQSVHFFSHLLFVAMCEWLHHRHPSGLFPERHP